MGMVVSVGRNRREELREQFQIGTNEKIVYFYLGRYGQDDLAWDRLASWKGVRFVGFHAAPIGALPNLHVVSADTWTGADLALGRRDRRQGRLRHRLRGDGGANPFDLSAASRFRRASRARSFLTRLGRRRADERRAFAELRLETLLAQPSLFDPALPLSRLPPPNGSPNT